MKRIRIIIFIVMSGYVSSIVAQDQIQWVVFEDLNDSLRANPKKVMIKIETSWCGYCKLMEKKVFNHKTTYKRLNDDYYFVRLDAEATQPIVFRNKQFQPASKKRGKHQLAIALNGPENPISFPAIVVLNANLELEKRLNGYLKRRHFLLWLAA
ncbi:MAG: thioredoxin family protein [Flavobacteriales bacterium]|jgi:thioredoxin-related protein|nr:thioredoxin family protein [Flavobacteriales bacterium]